MWEKACGAKKKWIWIFFFFRTENDVTVSARRIRFNILTSEQRPRIPKMYLFVLTENLRYFSAPLNTFKPVDFPLCVSRHYCRVFCFDKEKNAYSRMIWKEWWNWESPWKKNIRKWLVLFFHQPSLPSTSSRSIPRGHIFLLKTYLIHGNYPTWNVLKKK